MNNFKVLSFLDQQKLRRMARTTNRNHVKFEKRAKKALVQNAIE